MSPRVLVAGLLAFVVYALPLSRERPAHWHLRLYTGE
jgi:hypothetical protein